MCAYGRSTGEGEGQSYVNPRISRPLDGPTKAAELPADRLLRGPHRGLGPALRGRKTTTLVDELPKEGDSLLKPCVGHAGDRDSLPVEYAGWVRIVGTQVHLNGVEPVT